MLKVYGASDDLIEIEGADLDGFPDEPVLTGTTGKGKGSEELGTCAEDDVMGVVEVGTKETGGCRIRAMYTVGLPFNPGVWALSVEQLEEETPLMWPVRVVEQHQYSVAVEVDVPDGVPVRAFMAKIGKDEVMGND